MLALYQQAATTCPGLPWTILAAIGTVESDNGQSNLPGVHAGANAAGAEGPMQFEPATFAAYDEPVPPGGAAPPSPYDPTDAVYAAARLLCANGAAGGADLAGAVYAYNHSAAYVAQVLALAQSYAAGLVRPARHGHAGAVAVRGHWPRSGRPTSGAARRPGVGFDCSGLVQAAYPVAGVALPRVAQDQYDATPKLAAGRRWRRAISSSSAAARVHRPRRPVRGRRGRPRRHGRRAPHRGRRRAEAFPATPARPSGACSSSGRRGRDRTPCTCYPVHDAIVRRCVCEMPTTRIC